MPPRTIKSPRRILILSGPDSGVLPLLIKLTGAAPAPRTVTLAEAENAGTGSRDITTTVAGLSHSLNIRNVYYTADVPIWLDETQDPNEWKADFTSDEAGEVVRAVGAWIVVFRLSGGEHASNELRKTMAAVKEVISQAHDGDEDLWDGTCLAVGWGASIVGKGNGGVGEDFGPSTLADEVQDLEDLCLEYGFEFIDGRRGDVRDAKGELGGVARVREALESNDWDAGDDDELGLMVEDGEELGEFQKGEEIKSDFGLDETSMERELRELKIAGHIAPLQDQDGEEDEALQVEEFERMVGKMMAVRDMSAHLPKEERKKAASRAVNEFMKDK